MTDILSSIATAAAAMSWVEILATVTSAICVFLAVKRNIWSYPVGIVGTVAFFFVFWNIGLYSSAMLQVFFTGVQLYGWWFWLKGDRGAAPKISRINGMWAGLGVSFALIFAVILSSVTQNLGAAVPGFDAAIFGFSVVAQFFLDRKKLENWAVWFVVNAISIPVYWSQELYLTSLLYVIFLLNAGYGFYEWRKEYRSYPRRRRGPYDDAVALAKQMHEF